MQKGICLFVALFFMSACGSDKSPSTLSLRDLTKEEILSDFTQLTSTVKNIYGPLAYKEQRFGFTYADHIANSRAQLEASSSNEEAVSIFGKFLAKFEDGHIGYRLDPKMDETVVYAMDIFLTNIAGKVLVANIGPEMIEANDGMFGEHRVSAGDELVKIDGKPISEIIDVIKLYKSFGNDISDAHLAYLALRRPSYMVEIKPTQDTADLEFKASDNQTYHRTFAWTIKRDKSLEPKLPSDLKGSSFYTHAAGDFNDAAKGTLLTMGAPDPFFVTPMTRAIYNFSNVVPDQRHLTKYSIPTDAKLPKIFAALYQFNGKNILLVRQPDYVPADPELYIRYYKALLDQYEEYADVLVVDQNHNPGGSLLYVNNFFRLFIAEAKPNLVQHIHADREWISAFRSWAEEGFGSSDQQTNQRYLARAREVERAYDQGLDMTSPMTLFGDNLLQPHADYHWSKKVLVLADELAGSCGDIFPMLMKRSGTAKIFGQRTMGLGGNVVQMPALNYTRLSYSMTRGLFTNYHEGAYTNEELVENNGILPDYPYEHTVEDFRKGYVAYVAAFSAKAVEASN